MPKYRQDRQEKGWIFEMNKITKLWLFGKNNEPAEDIDTEYDPIYYGERPSSESSDEEAYDGYTPEEISEVKVISEQEPEPEPEEEPLYKVVFSPESCQDSYDIVECFKMGRVVIINAEDLPREEFFRMFDYVMGAVHALDGELQKITKTLVVLWPYGVDTELDIESIEDAPALDEADEDSDGEE